MAIPSASDDGSKLAESAQIEHSALVTGQMRVVFSADQAAAALWTYGEDDLVRRALNMSIDDLRITWRLAGDHWREDHGLPLQSRLVLDKVTAFACIEFLEGELRPLAIERRRSGKLMPERLRDAQPVPPGTKTDV